MLVDLTAPNKKFSITKVLLGFPGQLGSSETIYRFVILLYEKQSCSCSCTKWVDLSDNIPLNKKFVSSARLTLGGLISSNDKILISRL